MKIKIEMEIIPAKEKAFDLLDIELEIVGRDPIYASKEERRLILEAFYKISQPFRTNEPPFKFEP